MKRLFFCTFLILSSCTNPPDVSGQWTCHWRGVGRNCQDSLGDIPGGGTVVFYVTQQWKDLTASFIDTDGKYACLLIGNLSGTTLTGTAQVVYLGHLRLCRIAAEMVGKVTGKTIEGTFSGRELDCETCIWEGKFTVEIVP
ncbi:MAG TPA: hypothetical protein ACFYEI_00210 [Candidatus Tripitaka californicus]|uniref:hypothetical protein n=1 Tax=Candidatus Tripitaka californicus TaxID=3367616 RepID=UPI004027FD1A